MLRLHCSGVCLRSKNYCLDYYNRSSANFDRTDEILFSANNEKQQNIKFKLACGQLVYCLLTI